MPLPDTKQPPARILIQAIEPIVDCGRYPVKRTVGDEVAVYATIFKDGHDTLGASIRVRGPGDKRWSEVPLLPLGNDEGGVTLRKCEPAHTFTYINHIMEIALRIDNHGALRFLHVA